LRFLGQIGKNLS